MTPSEVAKVAESLTEAQRKILVEVFDGVPRWGVSLDSRDTGALAQFGLTTTNLTPLGEAVRDYLRRTG